MPLSRVNISQKWLTKHTRRGKGYLRNVACRIMKEKITIFSTYKERENNLDPEKQISRQLRK